MAAQPVAAKSGSLARAVRQHGPAYLMLAPTFLLLCVTLLYPMTWMLRYMFYDWNGYTPAEWVGLDNFVRLFTRDPLFWHAVWHTIVYAVGKLAICLPAALLLAVALNGKIRGRNLLRGIFFMPTVVSSAVAGVIFYYIFNSYNGVINKLLIAAHIATSPLDWFGFSLAMVTAILVAAWGAIGNYMVLFLAGLQSIPQEVYEAAAIDGANDRQTFFRITIPMLGPVLQTVCMLAIIVALKGYESMMVLTGGGPGDATTVVFLYIYRLFFPSVDSTTIVQQYGYGAAMSFIASLLVTAIALLYLRSSRRLQDVN